MEIANGIEKIVIIGGGESGRLLASSLERSGRRATLVTKQPHRSAGAREMLDVVEGECESLSETPSGVAVTLTNGAVFPSDIAILATGCDSFHPRGDGCVASPHALPRERGLDRNAAVFILGTGPVAVDYVLRLIDSGHNGPIYLLSRNGRLPLAGAAGEAFGIDLADIPLGTSLVYLLRWTRSLVAWCRGRGYDWRSVVDALKPHAAAIWRHLSTKEKRRFLVHARALWDAHVYRLTPDASKALSEALASGRLTVFAGRLASVSDAGVSFVLRGRMEAQRLSVRHVVNCEDRAIASAPSPILVIRNLLESGLARPDPLDLGLDVSRDCALIGADGVASKRLYAVGPPTRGAFYDALELSGIRTQSESLIRNLLTI